MPISRKKLVIALLGIVLFVVVGWLLPCPESLSDIVSQHGFEDYQVMRMLGTLCFAVTWWIGAVFPSWIPALIMVLSWPVLGVVPFTTAMRPFSEELIWQLAGVFVMAAAAKKTGLLKRIALKCMKAFGTTFRGQVLAMLASGMVVTPIIPAVAAKGILGSSMSMEVADAMGFENGSKGRTGLFMAALTGYASVYPAILTSSVLTYFSRSLMPADVAAGLTFIPWLMNSIVWLVVFLLCMFIGINLIYKPEHVTKLPDGFAQKKLDELGKIQRDEGITIAVISICVVLWILEGVTGLSTALVALVGGLALFITRVLPPRDLGANVNWSFLVFIGSILALGEQFVSMGISEWISIACSAIFSVVTHPVAIVIVLWLMTLAVNMVITSQAVVLSMLQVVLVSILAPMGFSPFVVAFILLQAATSYVVPYENPTFVASLEATDGTVPYRNVIPGSWLYVTSCIIGSVASVPYWMAIGLIV